MELLGLEGILGWKGPLVPTLQVYGIYKDNYLPYMYSR